MSRVGVVDVVDVPEDFETEPNRDDFADLQAMNEELASLNRGMYAAKNAARSLAIALLSEDVPGSELKNLILQVTKAAGVSAVQLRGWCEETRRRAGFREYLVPIAVIQVLDVMVSDRRTAAKTIRAERGLL